MCRLFSSKGKIHKNSHALEVICLMSFSLLVLLISMASYSHTTRKTFAGEIYSYVNYTKITKFAS